MSYNDEQKNYWRYMTMPDEKNIDVDVGDEEKKEDFEDICFLWV